MLFVIASGYRYGSTTPHIRVVYRGGKLFECPHWSVSENALYWSDIIGQKVYRMDTTNKVTSRTIGYGAVSMVIPVKHYPKLIVTAVGKELYLLPWDSYKNETSLRLISKVDVGLPDNRINDGKVDAKGRVWFGTMGKEVDGVVDQDKSTLYMVDKYNYQHPAVKVQPVSLSNGIAWSKNNKFMFYADSPTKKIDVFDFNLKKGDIKNRRTLFSFDTYNLTGVPDGMTIDTDDNLWVACCNGWKVIKVDSRTGRLLETFEFPVKKITSVIFGGPARSTLYVTSASEGLTSDELRSQPEAGALFAIEGTGSRGLPENQFRFPHAAKFMKLF